MTMKKLTRLFFVAFALLLLPQLSLAANTATAGTAIPIRMYGATKATPVVVAIDTTAQDLTVYAATSGKALAIVGWEYAEATAHNLTIKSGSNTLVVLENPANTVRDNKLGEGVPFMTAVGEALVIQSSAAITSMVIYVAEVERLG